MSVIHKCGYCGQVHRMGSECPEPPAAGSFVPAPGSDASPWPARDVVAKLVEAADILLDEKSYDGHGYELICGARRVANEWLRQNVALSHADEK